MSQTLQISSSGLNKPKIENENKKKKDKKQTEKQNLVALGDPAGGSNKVFIEGHSFFLHQQQT